MLPLPPHLAYIDPGTGSLVLQMIVAGIVGGIAFFRGAIFKFFGFFRRSKPKKDPESKSKN